MNRLKRHLKLFAGGAALAGALLVSGAASDLRADGCYICAGQPNTFVKFTGADSGAKRTAAKNCGCTVSGTKASCNAANYKVLCTVLNTITPGQSIAAAVPFCAKPNS